MARKTSTRAQVSVVAQRLLAEGKAVSVSAVRSALGGGSPNVITEELQKWRSSVRTPLPAPPAPPAPHEFVSPPSLELTEIRDCLQGVSRASSEMLDSAARLLNERKEFQVLLAQMHERFEAVQRYMLRAIDDAREDARVWKQRASAAQDELDTWRTTIHARLEKALQENGELRGALSEAQRASDARSRSIARE